MNLPLRLTECPLCISWLNVDNFTEYSPRIIAIRQQCFGNLFAAVGDRFIAPAYTRAPTYNE